MNKGLKILVIVLAVLAVLLIGGYLLLSNTIWKDKLDIVDAPAEDTAAPTDTPEPAVAVFDAPEATAEPESATPSAEPIYRAEILDREVINVLVVGGDSRDEDNPDWDVVGNSDTIMLASVNTKTGVISLVSFMRDSWVPIVYERSKKEGLLNSAYSNGGVGQLINTLNYNYALDIQDYVAVSFNGFIKLMDRIGGVEVEITKADAYYINWRMAGLKKADSKDNRLSLLKGMGKTPLEEQDGTVKLNGEQALWFARDRSTNYQGSKTASDFTRIARQQDLMTIVYGQLLGDSNIIANVPALTAFALESVQTNMSLDTITQLAEFVLTTDFEIVKIQVPYDKTWSYRKNDDGSNASGISFNIKKATAQLKLDLYGDGEAAGGEPEAAPEP